LAGAVPVSSLILVFVGTSQKISCDEGDRFLRILETNSENAAILFKRLAITLGKRLIETYPTTV